MFFDLANITFVLFAILVWGANRPWSASLFSAGLLSVFLCRTAWDLKKGHLRLRFGPLFYPLLAFLCLVALQYFRPCVALDASPALLPCSVEPHTTRIYLFIAAGCTALYLSITNGLRSRKRIASLMGFIIAIGVFESVCGLVQWIGGHGYVWSNPRQLIGAQGTLLNRNHYALLLNLSLCMGIGTLYWQAKRLPVADKLRLRLVLSMPEFPKLLWIMLWLGLIGLGVFGSLSRSGIFAMLASLGVMCIAIRAAERRRKAAFLVFSVFLTIVGLSAYTGMDPALERYAALASPGHIENSRFKLWEDAWPLVLKTPVFGSGLGTFQWTYPAYESLNPDTPAVYAHNDYLQLAAETGAAGLALLIWAFITFWKSARRNMLSGDPLVRGIGLCALGALAAASVQEMTDFSLYIPGVAALFVVLAGLNDRAYMLAEYGTKTSSEQSGARQRE